MSFLFGSEYSVSYAISNMITLTTVCGAVFTWYTTAITHGNGAPPPLRRQTQDNFVPTYTGKLITDPFTAYVLKFSVSRFTRHKIRPT